MPNFADVNFRQHVQHLLNRKTKPVGSLGQLEALALQLACILGDAAPHLRDPQLVVFAADHGIAARGVSAYPSDVTWQMVENFLAGGAAVAVLARQHGLTLTVVDCGVAHTFEPRPGLLIHKVAAGSADSSVEPAMSPAQCAAAIAHGQQVVQGLPGNALLLGEMGIGNTSAAALIMARLSGHALADCVGRGTGLDDAGMARKMAILQTALTTHANVHAPMDVLATLGGLEIATMVGAVLQATREHRVIVVDGFITTAAVAVAARLDDAVMSHGVFAHGSAEQGHARWLKQLGVVPLLDLGLRLGEGSGAALAWPLLVSACAILRDMASFESAGVSEQNA
jgi:nicotinate-nucleotide--dimethylbenzimidazole phosphoribosyltransferase